MKPEGDIGSCLCPELGAPGMAPPHGQQEGTVVALADTEMATEPPPRVTSLGCVALHSHPVPFSGTRIHPSLLGLGSPWMNGPQPHPPEAGGLAPHTAPLTLMTAFISGSFPSRLARRK